MDSEVMNTEAPGERYDSKDSASSILRHAIETGNLQQHKRLPFAALSRALRCLLNCLFTPKMFMIEKVNQGNFQVSHRNAQ